MPRVLLIGRSERLEPIPDRFSSMQEAASLDEGLRLLSAGQIDCVLADLSEDPQPADAIDRLAEAAGRAPIVALVAGDADVGTPVPDRVRLVSAGWLRDDPGTAWEYVNREFAVTRHLDELMRLRERQEQLVQTEKLAAVGRLAAEIAHEINNPATFVITNLTVMLDYVRTIAEFRASMMELVAQGVVVDLATLQNAEAQSDIAFMAEDLPVLLERSLAGLHRIHQIVRDLRYFARDRAGDTGQVDMEALLRASVGLVKHEAKYRARLVVDLPPLPIVQSDANRLSQVILNLLVNAVQAIEAGDPADNEVRLSARVTDQHVIICVSDTGSGMSPQTLARVFEPFFTTKEEGEGTGLGLPISQDIMRSLGGKLTVQSELGRGSTFEAWIPR